MRLKMRGGGDAVDYDSLTALVTDVIEGALFLGSGSDEIQTGTLPDMEEMHDSPGYSTSKPSIPVHQADEAGYTTDTDGNQRIVMAPPWGRYPDGNGAYVGCTPDDLGILAALIAVGESIAGVTGTYGSDATAAAGNIESGKTAYGSGGKITGSLTNYGSIVKTLSAGEYYTIAAGIYSSGKITATDLASQTAATAIAAYILSGYTAWVDGSQITGTMTDKQGTTTSAAASLDSDNSRVRLKIPTTGYYDTSAYLYATYSTIRSLIGLTAAKIASGSTILGLTGTYTDAGTATAAYILSGYIAYVAGSKLTGTMTNKAGTTTSATASLDSTNSYLKMKIPTTGYYDTSAYLYATYSTIRSLIGLTAAKIVKGVSILGLTGTKMWTCDTMTVMAYKGFALSSSNYQTSEEDSFTMPADGRVYYDGIAFSYNSYNTVTCEIYCNDELVDSRNIDSSNSYINRVTMVKQKFDVSEGDVIKVVVATSASSHSLAFLSAHCIYFS